MSSKHHRHPRVQKTSPEAATGQPQQTEGSASVSVPTDGHAAAWQGNKLNEVLGYTGFVVSGFFLTVLLKSWWRVRRQGGKLNLPIVRALWVIIILWQFMPFVVWGGQWSLKEIGWIYLFGLALSAILWRRAKAKGLAVPFANGSSTFGGARLANRDEVRGAGYLPEPNERPVPGGKRSALPLGEFIDMYRKPRKKLFGFIRMPSAHAIDQPWNGINHPNTLMYQAAAHFITVAPARSGKARDVLIPVLLSPYLGSTIQIDPKGQLAAVTARARAKHGNKVVVLNPFGMHAGRIPASTGFNPMAFLMPGHISFGADCDSLAGAIVVEAGSNDRHFAESAEHLISGVIMYFAKYGKPEERNLVSVRAAIASPPEVFMAVIDAAMATGDLLVTERLSRFAGMTEDDREAKGILSTARTQTAFLSNEAIRQSLSSNGLTIEDLRGATPTTVYVILPGEYLDACKKWFRLVIDTLLRGLMAHPTGREVHMVLDEFANLGHLASVETAMGLASGYGVKLHPVLQDLNQLKELYRDKWQTFLANAGGQQFFAPRDQFTADYVSKRCGKTTISVTSTSQREISNGEAQAGMTGESSSTHETGRDLFMPQEVMSLGRNKQLLFLDGVPQVVLANRYPYWCWPEFQGLYDPDPYHV